MASAKRQARIEITSSAAGVDRGLNDARRRLRAFERDQQRSSRAMERDQRRRAREQARALSAANRGIGGAISHGIGMAAGFAGIGAASDAIRDVFDVEKEMTRFQIDAQQSDAAMAGFREQIMAVSNATGQSRNAIVHAAHGYQILTGDANGAIDSVRLFAEVANASGASMEDIGAAAAAMRTGLKLDPAQFREAFDVILSMGHKSSIELRGFAGELASLAPMFKQFGSGSPMEKMAKLGAALEASRHGFGSDAEAATGLQSLMTGIQRHRKKLEAAGIRVVNKDGSLRDFFEIIDEMKKKKFSLTELTDELGRVEGVKAALQLVQEANGEMHDLYNTALGSNQVAKDNFTYMNSASGKLAMAWETIKNAIASALSPERIEKFANALVKAGDFFVNAVGALDYLLTGGSKEAGAGNAAKDFVEAASAGGPETHQQVVAAAFEAQQSDEERARKAGQSGDYLKALAIMGDINPYGSNEAERAGAREFLTSEGYDVGQTFKFGQTRTDTTRDVQQRELAQAQQALDPAAFAKNIGIAFAREIAPLLRQPPPVKVGAEPIVKASGNSVLQRTRPGGRS